MTLSVRGIPRTKAALARVQAEIEAASPVAVKAAGDIVARAMVARAPRRTGALASSIRVDVSSLGEGAVAKVGAEVPYDRFVQKGTVYMAAQPYGEEAADDTPSPIVAAMLAIYRTAIH